MGILMDIDNIIDAWARGNISNDKLRSGVKSLGAEILNKRITKGMASDSLEIAMPSGRVRTDFNVGGVVARKKKTKNSRKKPVKRDMAIVISVGAIPLKKKPRKKVKK